MSNNMFTSATQILVAAIQGTINLQTLFGFWRYKVRSQVHEYILAVSEFVW
jgi:hypothetical protein